MSAPQPTGLVPGPHVLVADGSADMRRYIEGCLQALEPMHVVQAADGRAALHLARAVRPALIIADRAMPGLSSPMLCRALQANTRTRSIPVLIISDEAQSAPLWVMGFSPSRSTPRASRPKSERLLGRPLAPQGLLP